MELTKVARVLSEKSIEAPTVRANRIFQDWEEHAAAVTVENPLALFDCQRKACDYRNLAEYRNLLANVRTKSSSIAAIISFVRKPFEAHKRGKECFNPLIAEFAKRIEWALDILKSDSLGSSEKVSCQKYTGFGTNSSCIYYKNFANDEGTLCDAQESGGGDVENGDEALSNTADSNPSAVILTIVIIAQFCTSILHNFVLLLSQIERENMLAGAEVLKCKDTTALIVYSMLALSVSVALTYAFLYGILQFDNCDVMCEDQVSVTALSLEGNLLRSIPPKISMLSLLKRLEIADNFIQPDGMSIKSLSKLSNLHHVGMGGKHNLIQTHLAVSKQKLTCAKKKCGDVETITKFFDGLQILDLSKNEFGKGDSGRYLYDELTKLVRLSHLDLSHNFLANVPYQLLNMSNLQTLSLSQNKIQSISICFNPADSHTCSNNGGTGSKTSVENLFKFMERKGTLFLSQNPFVNIYAVTSRPIAEDVLESLLSVADDTHSTLQSFEIDILSKSIADRQNISSSLCMLRSLEFLNVRGNVHVSSCISELTNLKFLRMSGKVLSHEVASAVFNGLERSFSMITYIKLWKCGFREGEELPVPKKIKSPDIALLDINGCNLNGTIGPGLVRALRNATIFYFSSTTSVHGTMPKLDSLQSLLNVNLNNNNLEGNFPITDGSKMNKLMYAMAMSRNKFEGTLPNLWKIAPALTRLELNGNKFTGKLAQENIGKLIHLQTLMLDGNSFEGRFQSLYNLQNLTLFSIDEKNFPTVSNDTDCPFKRLPFLKKACLHGEEDSVRQNIEESCSDDFLLTGPCFQKRILV
eukprot:g3108.t1